MELFQSWADTVIIFILVIAYIVTFFVQRTTIKKLQEQLEAIEKTNKAATALTEMQSSHIDTYKKLVDINEVEQHAHLKAINLVTDMLSNKEDLMELFKVHANNIINQSIMDNNIEHMRFLKFTFTNILKFDKETQKAIIDKYFPKGRDVIHLYFDKVDEIAEIQKNQS